MSDSEKHRKLPNQRSQDMNNKERIPHEDLLFGLGPGSTHPVTARSELSATRAPHFRRSGGLGRESTPVAASGNPGVTRKHSVVAIGHYVVLLVVLAW